MVDFQQFKKMSANVEVNFPVFFENCFSVLVVCSTFAHAFEKGFFLKQKVV